MCSALRKDEAGVNRTYWQRHIDRTQDRQTHAAALAVVDLDSECLSCETPTHILPTAPASLALRSLSAIKQQSKCKLCHIPKGALIVGVGGSHLPDSRWAYRWIYHCVCDAWPVRRQIYGYLQSLRPNQFILLSVRGTCVCVLSGPFILFIHVWTTCPGLHPQHGGRKSNPWGWSLWR